MSGILWYFTRQTRSPPINLPDMRDHIDYENWQGASIISFKFNKIKFFIPHIATLSLRILAYRLHTCGVGTFFAIYALFYY